MVSCLVDTDIVVDLIRQRDAALLWLKDQTEPGVSTAVWLEVLQGAQNKQDQQIALTVLGQFEQIDVTESDFHWAIRQITKYGLSHGVSAMDCLIASSSHRLQVPLFTRNLKHFAPLLPKLVDKPY